jgi:hypothetical protein
VPFLRCFRRNPSQISNHFNFTQNFNLTQKTLQRVVFIAAAMFLTLPCFSQDQPPSPDSQNSQSSSQNSPTNSSPTQNQAAIKLAPITIPAGTTIPLVLTQPVQSRSVRRGDDIYAQVTDPVDAGNQVAIPAGTFVQGTVDKVDRHSGRAELRLQAMSITFPDGYVAPIAGAITLQTSDGYALRDPGPSRTGAAIGLIGGGAGIGALIGHSVGSSSTTITASIPQGCTGPPPGCISSSTTGPGRKGFDTGVGLTVGAAAGGVAAFTLLASSHHFFIDAGTPLALTLPHPVTLTGNEVAEAVRQSAKHPMPPLAVAPRPVPPPPPDTSSPFPPPGTPMSPGTPPTIIPGPPGPGGVPGAPIIIPGTPPGA